MIRLNKIFQTVIHSLEKVLSWKMRICVNSKKFKIIDVLWRWVFVKSLTEHVYLLFFFLLSLFYYFLKCAAWEIDEYEIQKLIFLEFDILNLYCSEVPLCELQNSINYSNLNYNKISRSKFQSWKECGRRKS